MKHINKDFIENNTEFIINEIQKGKIFIYPTDTVYGIGCDARNDEAVKKFMILKKEILNHYL